MTPFASEFLGTAVLAAIGTAVMCAVRLPRTAGSATDGPGMGWLGIALGWGAALALGYFVNRRMDTQLNPALTLAMWSVERTSTADAWSRVAGQGAGTVVGMALAWAAFIPHWARAPEGTAAGVLYRVPAIRAPLSNLLSSTLGSAILLSVLLRLSAGAPVPMDADASDAGMLPAAMPPFMVANPAEGSILAGLAFAAVILGFGAIGSALHPALGIGGRVCHAVLPIPGKGRTDWSDAWIALVGPALGAFIAAAVWRATVA